MTWPEAILNGDRRALARAATAIENRRAEAEELLRELFPHTGKAQVIGVTGAPGAGKSTLVDMLLRELRREGMTAGVIAVDPSSPYTGGAILGDRIRMQEHYADPGVFIRSMATRGHLGGLAPAAMEMALLFDAAGMDAVLVETVGVGQDEVEIARLADATAVVLVPGMGDDVQALKAGILEIADVFLINKADHPGAERLERELEVMLGLAARRDGWVPPIVKTTATDGKGIPDALAAIKSCLDPARKQSRAPAMWSLRLREMLRERLLDRFPESAFEAAAADVAARRRDPFSIVNEWLG